MAEKWHGPLLAGCASLFVVAASASEYRLAGTIELDADHFIAIVDEGDGRQQIVHVGDQLGVAEIVAIGDQEVVLQTASGLMVLSLEGAAAPSLPEAESPPVIADMVVDAELLMRLQRVSGSDERQVTAAVLKALELPEELTVREVWVRAGQFSRMHLALPEIQSALQAGDMAHLFFEKGGPVDEMYLMPVRPEQKD